MTAATNDFRCGMPNGAKGFQFLPPSSVPSPKKGIIDRTVVDTEQNEITTARNVSINGRGSHLVEDRQCQGCRRRRRRWCLAKISSSQGASFRSTTNGVVKLASISNRIDCDGKLKCARVSVATGRLIKCTRASKDASTTETHPRTHIARTARRQLS